MWGKTQGQWGLAHNFLALLSQTWLTSHCGWWVWGMGLEKVKATVMHSFCGWGPLTVTKSFKLSGCQWMDSSCQSLAHLYVKKKKKKNSYCQMKKTDESLLTFAVISVTLTMTWILVPDGLVRLFQKFLMSWKCLCLYKNVRKKKQIKKWVIDSYIGETPYW